MKLKPIILLSLILVSNTVATMIEPKTLRELINMADHVVIGKIKQVSMVDDKGNELHDMKTRTGPGLSNELRLHVAVIKSGVIKTTEKKVPKNLVIPLWQAWHFTLGQWKKEEGKTYIFLLKGKDFSRVSPMEFRRDLSERAEIEQLLSKKDLN